MANSHRLVREPHAKPSHADRGESIPSTCNTINLRHPGYETSNILLSLPALDPGGSLHHETARLACCILADNRWEGFLTEDKEGQKRVDIPTNGTLTREDYYFHVSPNYPEKYPIVPTFSDWKFPHRNLPEYWRDCHVPRSPDHDVARSNTALLLSRDISCRITAYQEGTEIAHLVPRSEQIWFKRNQMGRYNTTLLDPEPANNPRNSFLLRSDVHTLFDARKFAIVPKGGLSGNKPSFVIHTLVNEATSELVQLYHNVALQPLSGIAVEFIFARLAWTLFRLSTIFLDGGVERFLTVYDEQGYTTRSFSDAQCMDKAKQSRTRSMSPRNRQRDGPEDVLEGSSEEGFESESEERGRKRRRTSFALRGASLEITDSSFYSSLHGSATDNSHSEDKNSANGSVSKSHENARADAQSFADQILVQRDKFSSEQSAEDRINRFRRV